MYHLVGFSNVTLKLSDITLDRGLSDNTLELSDYVISAK